MLDKCPYCKSNFQMIDSPNLQEPNRGGGWYVCGTRQDNTGENHQSNDCRSRAMANNVINPTKQ